jgi:hypothetical protein
MLDKQQQLAVLLKYGNERKHGNFYELPGMWQRIKEVRQAPQWLAAISLPLLPQNVHGAA